MDQNVRSVTPGLTQLNILDFEFIQSHTEVSGDGMCPDTFNMHRLMYGAYARIHLKMSSMQKEKAFSIENTLDAS